MADERLRNKSELKRLFTGLKRKGITDEMMSIAIDSLWRDKLVQRTSGFEFPAHFDSEISFDTNTRIFSIKPWDPQVEGFLPRFGIYAWTNPPVFNRIYDTLEIEIPNEEGLYCVYFDDEPGGTIQILFCKKNPTAQELETIYLSKVIISFLYWDAQSQSLIYFGDDRHGSEWNPQIQWWAHTVFNGMFISGFDINNLLIGDGSLNAHAQAGIATGLLAHEDIEHSIAAANSTTGLPVMWFSGAGKLPRIENNPGYMFLQNTFLNYNNLGTGKAECTDKYFMLYHVFATNCQLYPLVSVMGINQYASKNDCCKAALDEVKAIKEIMPQQTRLAITSFVFEINSEFENDVKARIVQPCAGQGAIIWIEEITNWFDILIQITGITTKYSVTGTGAQGNEIKLVNDIEFNNSKMLYAVDWKGTKRWLSHDEHDTTIVNQPGHGFTSGQPVYNNGSGWALADANDIAHAANGFTIPLYIFQVIGGVGQWASDPDFFGVRSFGFLYSSEWLIYPAAGSNFSGGVRYYLSITAGEIVDEITALAYPEGKVLQYLGTGASMYEYRNLRTPQLGDSDGMILCIERGKVIGENASAYVYVAYASDNSGTGWSLTPTNLLKYRAEIHSTTPITPVESDFATSTWVKYLGDNGADGHTPVKGVDYFDGSDGAPGADGYTPVKGVDYFDGSDGAPGADGYTPVKGVDYFDGSDGAPGADGYTPVKGVDYFDGSDGAPGSNGYTPVKGVDYFDGSDGAPGADGADGNTPYIQGGYWYIDGISTGVLATGPQGIPGMPGSPGAPGSDGDDGLDAFVYVAYASDVSGTGWSLAPTDLLKYRAEIHSTTALTPVESDFSAATWVKYIGEDGTGGTGSDAPELHLDFEEAGDEFVYNVPYNMKFTSMVCEGTDATLDIALNTDMPRYTKLTITATATGMVSLYGVYI